MESSLTSYQLAANVEETRPGRRRLAGLGNSENNSISGNQLGNYLLGGGGADYRGAGGNDILNGSEGDDLLIGGAGNDWLEGGAGHDIYALLGEAGSDLISDTASAGAGNQLYLSRLELWEVQLDYSGMTLRSGRSMASCW